MAEWEQERATIGGNILHHHLTKPFPPTSVHVSHRTEETLTVSKRALPSARQGGTLSKKRKS